MSRLLACICIFSLILVMTACKSPEIESIAFDLSFDESFELEMDILLDTIEVTIYYDDGSESVILFANEDIVKESGMIIDASSTPQFTLDTQSVGTKTFAFSYLDFDFETPYYVYDPSIDLDDLPDDRR
jgi:hypothetical protein